MKDQFQNKASNMLSRLLGTPGANQQGEAQDHSRILRILSWYHSWATKKILKLEMEVESLKKQLMKAEKLATTDPLTGLSNRRYVEDALTQASERRQSAGTHILYIDLKKFKAINDTYGHDAGDKALRVTADFLTRNVREKDIVGRLGGDEFIVILEGMQKDAAMKKVQEIENGFRNLNFDFAGTKIDVRGTVGHYEVEENDMPVQQIIKKSDTAMYLAKNAPEPVRL